MKSIFSIILITLFLLSCNGNLPDLKGRYIGTKTKGREKIQVISQIPEFENIGKTKVLFFKIYPTLASASGDQFNLVISKRGSVIINAPGLPLKGVSLTLANNNCAIGTEGTFEISACWSTGKIDFYIKDAMAPEKSTALHLVRDENLPTLETNKIYSLDELMGRAKYINYSVSKEAERVLQAKHNIGVARGNLLPKLNIKSLVGIIKGDFISAVGTVLPFLFPSNWFQWKMSKELYKAERNSFASLRGNEMNMVESLYYLILRDQMVLEKLKNQIEWMKKIQETLKKEEEVGTLQSGTSDYFGTSIAILERDKNNFEGLVNIEYGQLAHATALPPLNGIKGLAPMDFLFPENVPPISPEDFFMEAKDKSYEIKSLGFLLNAAKYSEIEVYFDFLDVEGTSGIGFGTPYQIMVSKSKQNEIKMKIEESKSIIELQSSIVATEFNQALENHQLASLGINSSRERVNWIVHRILQGESTVDENELIDQLVDTQYKVIGFIADQATSAQAFLIAKSKMNRLLLKEYYSDLEAALPEEPKKGNKTL